MAELAFLLRHGDYESNYQGESLTSLGREQSEQARDDLIARELGGKAYVLSSDARRAMETAEIIGEGLGVDVIASPQIRRGSSHRCVVDHLGSFLAGSLRLDGGIEPEPDRPFVAVVHAPLIAALKLRRDNAGIESGRVEPFGIDQRDPDYDAAMAELILSGGLES